MKKLIPVIVVAVVVAAGFWFFPQRDRDSGSPLDFAPEDTPFVFAAADRLPEPVLAIVRDQLRQMGPMYAQQWQAMRELARHGDADGRLVALSDALAAEFAGQAPDQVFATLGIDVGGRFALFGQRLVPVARLELEDPERIPALVTRIEARTGQPLPGARLDGQAYWQVPLGGLGVDLLMAVVADHLVLSAAPRDAGDAVIAQLLGLRSPSRSLASTGGLRDLQRRLGFHGYFSGYIDTRRFVDALASQGTPAELAFEAALGIARPTLTPPCRGELDALANAWPRLSFGYTRLDAERVDALALLETRGDIAADLMTLRAPMPGREAAGAASQVEFGMAYRLAALPALVNRYADAVRAEPWQCPQLESLNAAFAGLRAQMANPALFMAAPLLDSVHVSLDSLALPDPASGGSLPSFSGVLAIGSQNPASLLAMAQTVAPQLAALGLEPDGQPRPLSLADQGLDLTAQVAMAESSLALAVGDAAIARLPRALVSEASAQPVLVFGIDSVFYAGIIDMMLDATLAPLDGLGDDAFADADVEAAQETQALLAELEQARREMEQMAAIIPTLFRRMHLSVELTERGVELIQRVDMP